MRLHDEHPLVAVLTFGIDTDDANWKVTLHMALRGMLLVLLTPVVWLLRTRFDLRPRDRLLSRVHDMCADGDVDGGLQHLQEVRDRLAAGETSISPYGRFMWTSDLMLDDDIRRSAMRYNRWQVALEAAERQTENIELLDDVSDGFDLVLVDRIRCLRKLGRTAEATALLVQWRDPQRPDSVLHQL